MDPNREAAYKILLKIEREASFSNLAIKDYLGSMNIKGTTNKGDINANLVRRLVYGVLENSLYLDYFLDKIMSKGLKGTKPELLTILRMGAYQLEFMNSVPDYAAVNTSVELAKRYVKGMDKLVNGVLRNWTRKKGEISLPGEDDLTSYLSILYSCDKGIVAMLRDQRGDEDARRILEAVSKSSDERGIVLRLNINKDKNKDKDIDTDTDTDNKTKKQVLDELAASGFSVKEGSLSERVIMVRPEIEATIDITELKSFRDGLISIQSEESCWIADMASPKAGDRVLDLCSAPGGKTLAMAESMGSVGEIVACDLYPHRLSLVEKNALRLGIDIIKTISLDATKASEVEKLGGDFDVVLVDAPCSGLGVISKKPEIKLRSPKTSELTEIQKNILQNASTKVRPGGRLVYSTCTIDRRENEDIVKGFLEGNEEFTLESERQLIPGIDEYDGFYMAIMNRD